MPAEKKETSAKGNNIAEEFATSTTMHGVLFLYMSQSKLGKVLWIILIIGMICALISQVTIRIMDFFQYATSTDISEQFVTHLEFPAVTICSFNRFYQNSNDQKLINAFHTINQMTSPKTVAYMAERKEKPDLDELAPIGNLSIKDLLDKHGFSISNRHMPRCTFKYLDCTSEDFEPIYSWMGKCFTFNEGNSSRIQNIPGGGHGLSATINIRHDMFTEEPLVGNTEAGVKIQVHPQNEAPDVGTYGISVPVGKKASIELSRTDHNMMYEPWGRCNPNRENLKFFTDYTLNNCLQECYTDAVINQCGCYIYSHHWAQGHARACTINEMYDCAAEFFIAIQQNYSATDCNCAIPCHFTTYDLTISYSSYPNLPSAQTLAERMGQSVDYVLSNLVEIEVFFKSMSYRTFSQSKKVSESSLLSDVGGQLGLWLGMSIITAVEVIQFLVLRISHGAMSKNKVKNEKCCDVRS